MVACRMCGRTLTTKASRRLGIGPECQAKVKAAEIRNAPDGVYSGGDIVCRRDIFGTHVNVPYKKAEHKRTQEITWGSDSTGDLALNILMLFIPYRKAVQRHRYFKFKFLDALPYEGGVIKEKAIQEFLRETGAIMEKKRGGPKTSKHPCAGFCPRASSPKGIPILTVTGLSH